MQAILLGVQELDFTSTSGNQIQGNNIFVCFEQDGIIGHRTEKFFLKKEITLPEKIKINDSINIFFNHKGKVEAINKI